MKLFTMAMVLMALAAVSGLSMHQDAFAQNTGMAITATADQGSDTIMINGQTMSTLDITLTVMSPSGNNVVAVDQVTPNSDGSFDTTLMVGDLWKENGFYSITAKQGSSLLYKMNVLVEVNEGMTARTMSSESSLEVPYGGQSDSILMIERGLSIKAEAMVGSTNIGITGKTDKTNMDVTLAVTSPNGNRVGVGQVTPDTDGMFAIDITTGGPLWKQDGFYTVSAQQGSGSEYMDSVVVEIKDGAIVPEFGTIAVMVLAAAIISIIAITARSGLSIMPRY